MGSTTSSDQYERVGRDSIYHFGQINILQNPTHSKQFFKQIYDFLILPESELAFVRKLQCQNNQCGYLMQIKAISYGSVSQCSNTSRIEVVFEYFPVTLLTLIRENKQFEESEVIRIFGCLLEAVKHLNMYESYHGDISPQFIYVDSQTNNHTVYKIFDSAYFRPVHNGYYRAQQEKVYCAPEILTNLGEKRLFPIYNHYTADTFSIGLMILYCMTSIDPLAAYKKNNEIDTYLIESMFRIAYRKQYSPELIDSVRYCLQYRNRPNASEVLQNNSHVFQSFLLHEQNNLSLRTKLSLKKSKMPKKSSRFFTHNLEQS